MEFQKLPRRSFRPRVLAVVARIPRGQVRTYAQVARLAGRPKAYRAVGSILSHNFDPEISCHRVIRSDGKVGGYNRGSLLKKKLLRREKALSQNQRIHSNSSDGVAKPSADPKGWQRA